MPDADTLIRDSFSVTQVHCALSVLRSPSWSRRPGSTTTFITNQAKTRRKETRPKDQRRQEPKWRLCEFFWREHFRRGLPLIYPPLSHVFLVSFWFLFGSATFMIYHFCRVFAHSFLCPRLQQQPPPLSAPLAPFSLASFPTTSWSPRCCLAIHDAETTQNVQQTAAAQAKQHSRPPTPRYSKSLIKEKTIATRGDMIQSG